MSEAAGERATIPVGDAGETLALRLVTPPDDDAQRPTLLYLHGFGSAQDGEKAVFFRRWAVRRSFAFASIDFRGHGESGGPLERLTFTRTLEDVEAALAWLRARGRRRLVLFGSSMGGAAALWLTVRRPASEVEGVVAIAPALAMQRSLGALAGPEGLERWRRSGAFEVSNELVTTVLGWELMEDLARYPAEELAAELRAPVLVLQGLRDTSVDPRQAVALAERAAGADLELHLFAAGDHRLLAQRPRIAALVEGWLAAHGLLAASG